MTPTDRRRASRAELLAATARTAAAATDAYRDARDRRAAALRHPSCSNAEIHAERMRAVLAADLQLDAALATEREVYRALTDLRENGLPL